MKILTFLQSFWGRFIAIACLLTIFFSILFVVSTFVSGLQPVAQNPTNHDINVSPLRNIDPQVATAQNPIREIYTCTAASLPVVGATVRERMKEILSNADKVLIENNIEKMRETATQVLQYFVEPYISSFVSEAESTVRTHPYISAGLRARTAKEVEVVKNNQHKDKVKELCDSVLTLSTTLGEVKDLDKKNRYIKSQELQTPTPTPMRDETPQPTTTNDNVEESTPPSNKNAEDEAKSKPKSKPKQTKRPKVETKPGEVQEKPSQPNTGDTTSPKREEKQEKDQKEEAKPSQSTTRS